MEPTQLSQALTELKALALDRIARLAQEGDVRPIRALGELAAAIEADVKLAREIEARHVRYAREVTGARLDWDGPAPVGAGRLEAAPVAAAPVGAARLEAAPVAPERLEAEPLEGEDPRTAFLAAAAQAGQPLDPMSRTLYVTRAGKSVAVPFANESRPGRWLLSVEDMRYDLVALLCQPAEGDLRVFVLPRRALDPVWKGLSRSGRHVKLGVANGPEGFRLQVPGGEPVPLAEFADAYPLLGQS